MGIDIVCKEANGEFWAVQCKFYAETSIIDKAAVDWEKLDAGIFGKQAVNDFREPKEHQLNAINAAQAHFQNNNRGRLIMACGTGKTYTSLKIAETLTPNGKILFLVPSISLLGQILYEWATFAEKLFNYICVCSDEISRRLETFSDNMTVIFSTYQSLDKVSAAKIDFDLIICDEAHRTTGSSKDSISSRAQSLKLCLKIIPLQIKILSAALCKKFLISSTKTE